MLTTTTTIVMAVVSAILSRGIDFGIVFSGILVGLGIFFEVSDFKKNIRLKSLKASLLPHLKIIAVMFVVFFVLKMISLA
jgi:hypothetical protein